MPKNACLLMVPILLGCGSRSTMSGPDASALSDLALGGDGVASGDVAVASDMAAPNDGPADTVAPTDPAADPVSRPEVAPDSESTRQDAPAEARSDLRAQPDLAVDVASRDGRMEAGIADILGPDNTSPSDASDDLLPEVAPETQPRDAASDLAPDAPPEVAREVPPFVVDGALASFCSGDLAHMVLNGTESYPVVTGRQIPLSCCAAGQFVVTTQTFAEPLAVTWRVSGGAPSGNPAVVDLGSLPVGWSVRVAAGCDPLMSSCTTPGDVHEAGLEGVLELINLRYDYDMSLCLRLVEPAGSSHQLLHTLDLYAPHVLAPR